MKRLLVFLFLIIIFLFLIFINNYFCNKDTAKTNNFLNNDQDINNLYTISNNGKIYKNGRNLLIKDDNTVGEIELNEELKNVSPIDIFLSEDANYLYLAIRSYRNENKSNLDKGKVVVYDINTNQSFDLFKKLSYTLNGFLHWATYKDNKMLILREDINENKSLIYIDLLNNSYSIINLPYKYVTSVDFIGDNFSCNCYDELLKKNILTVINSNGNILKRVNVKNLGTTYIFKASDNGNNILFSTGNTPQGLILYNFELDKEYTIIPPESKKDELEFLIYSAWKNNDTIYIYEMLSKDVKNERKYNLREENINLYIQDE
ncbi:hypothetical protein Psch_01168 [Pelotomaculum schinkii]|uniref:Protein TolB n=1 Tax=Pelotomaculum schinkii TaxID=78350 RepID=A0A4Y7RFR2_9FIRM|nr:hypothetical protein [Pelotomaculum schinkii]TEB07613.1 hypothetical protein Psch_01168 [Pelotomaculum schinkii]